MTNDEIKRCLKLVENSSDLFVSNGAKEEMLKRLMAVLDCDEE